MDREKIRWSSPSWWSGAEERADRAGAADGRESLELDLRALVVASAPAAEQRSSEPDLYLSPDWALIAPPTLTPRAAASAGATLGSLFAAGIGGAALALSVVAIAAVPTWTERGTVIEREHRDVAVSEPEAAIAPRETDEASERAGEASDAPEPGLEPEAVTGTVEAETEVDPIVVRPVRAARAPSAIRTAPSSTRPPAVTSTAPSPGSIDPGLGALVDAALAGRASDPATAALPDAPPARELAIRLRALERDIAMCRPDDAGLLRARIVLDGATGGVRSVIVTADSPSASPSIDCATRLIAATTVPRFARDHFALTFPYRL